MKPFTEQSCNTADMLTQLTELIQGSRHLQHVYDVTSDVNVEHAQLQSYKNVLDHTLKANKALVVHSLSLHS